MGMRPLREPEIAGSLTVQHSAFNFLAKHIETDKNHAEQEHAEQKSLHVGDEPA